MLIGRRNSIAIVAAELRAGRPVAVVGEAGIGKTSIVRAAAARTGRVLHEGGGFATLAWLPYLALRRAVELGSADGPAAVAAAVRQAVGRGVLFIDDYQWVDDATRAVIERLGREPVAAVAVAVRAGEPGAERLVLRLARRGLRIVRLQGLEPRAALALAARHFPDMAIAERRRVARAAGANPLLIEVLGRRREAPPWLVRPILRQLEDLDPTARTALGRMTAGGRPAPASSLGRAAAPLLERGFVERAGRGLRIRHALIERALGGGPHAGLDLELRAARVTQEIEAGALHAAAAGTAALLAEALPSTLRRRVLFDRGRALGLLGDAEAAGLALAEAAATAAAPGAAVPSESALLTASAEVSLWAGVPERALQLAASAQQAARSAPDRLAAALAAAWAEVELGRAPTFALDTAPRAAATGIAAEHRALHALAAPGPLAEPTPHAAIEAFDRAAAGWAGRHRPRELICRWAAGEARRRGGDPAAGGHLAVTLQDALAIGFEPLAARARRSLRLAGERPATVRRDRVAGDVLTSRERQVLDLVERGRSNLEIARRMGLGRPTVARMLSNAMLKLGAVSRAHAVVLAAERSDDRVAAIAQ